MTLTDDQVRDKLEDTMESLRDATAVMDQVWKALEKINDIVNKWTDGEIEDGVALETIGVETYPFFVERDE